MFDFALVEQIFKRIQSALNFLEVAEKKHVVRCLRVIYFYPDELLKHLDEIIETKAEDPSSAIAAGAEFVAREPEMDEALNFITSQSVMTNLKLTVEMVEELREIADFKRGVRATLHAIFFVWMFERDRDEVLELAKQAREEIGFLNEQIRNLEKAIL